MPYHALDFAALPPLKASLLDSGELACVGMLSG